VSLAGRRSHREAAGWSQVNAGLGRGVGWGVETWQVRQAVPWCHRASDTLGRSSDFKYSKKL